jgi:DNA gyrase subunit A
MTDEDLIADEDVVVTSQPRGYIKRQPLGTYRRQRRGGKGIIGADDARRTPSSTCSWPTPTTTSLFFTNRGRVFSTKVHAIPDASRQAKGMPIINLEGVQVEQREYVLARPHQPAATSSRATTWSWPPAAGSSRRRRSSSSRRSARRASAINLVDDDELQWVGLSDGRDDIIVATKPRARRPLPRGRGPADGPRRTPA